MLDDYQKLQSEITVRAGADTAQLFAEPIVTWGNGENPGSISWYADTDGDGTPLQFVPPERRKRLEDGLAVLLGRLLALRDDPAIGPLLTRALVLASSEGILAVGDQVVLVDWGQVPEGASTDSAGLAAQYAATLGPYAPSLAKAPPVSPPPVMPVTPPPLPIAAAAPLAKPQGSVAPVWNRWLIPAALATAALFLALGLWLGARAIERQFASRPDTVRIANADAIRDAVARRQAENAALEAQIEATKRAFAGNACVADPAQVPAMVPPETPITPEHRPPPPPGQAAFQGTLIELLRQATVLVLVPQGDNLALGSGFFIGPKSVATNRHVVEAAGPDGILVVNAKLGRPMRATVVAQTPNSEIYNPDVAVLSVPDAPTIQPLAFTRIVEQLDTVVAAGFPGVLLGADEGFKRLLRGDLAAMPSVILTDGRINAVQTAPTGLPILPHSAQISGGNSGGPLVDACGRVVGINTFINVASDQAVHINYAEKADAVLDFLREKQIEAADQTGPCQPASPPQGALPAAPVTPAAAPAAGAAAPR